MNKQLLSFINSSPTAFHAVANTKDMLLKNGFIELKEYQTWQLQRNQKYFVIRNDSAIIAFTTPSVFSSIQVTASHVDSPTFKIKEKGVLIDNSQVRLNVEKYGGMILSSWFDRPLSIAGRMVVDNGTLQSQLVTIDEDIAMIPNVAIHLNRTINDGYHYNVQKEVLPLIGQATEFNLIEWIKEKQHIIGDVIASDLFLYTRQLGAVWGVNKEFISAPRIDNLECTYGLLQGMLNSSNDTALNMCLMFDNEEVGSSTKQGADSTFFSDTLVRIKECFGLSEQEYLAMIASGFMISADNAHGYHPSYKELYDVSCCPKMNEGIVVKHNANQKYTSDAISVAIFKTLCKKAGVPCQDFVNNSNVLGGSTLGNIANTHISLNTVDIGLAQLAMHSAYETAGSKDFNFLVDVITYFYNHTIKVEDNILKM